MRQTRNPRYAPEFLERKLSPSSLVASPVPAQVHVVSSVAAMDHPPTLPPYDPTHPPTGLPPTVPPTHPGGPTDPC